MEIVHSKSDIELVKGIIQAHKNILNETNEISIDKYERKKNRLLQIIISKHYDKILNSLRFENSISDYDSETFVIKAFYDFYLNILSGKYQEVGTLSAYVKKLAKYSFINNNRRNKKEISFDKKNEEEYENTENKIYRESKNSTTYLDDLDNEIFDTEEEKEEIFNCVQEMIKNLSEECQGLIYAQFSYNKISDKEYYEEHKDNFSSVNAVRKKRGKCMDKLRNNSNVLNICKDE